MRSFVIYFFCYIYLFCCRQIKFEMSTLTGESGQQSRAKASRALSNNYEALGNILTSLQANSRLDPESLRLLVTWKEIASAKSTDELQALIVLAMACLAIGEGDLLTSSTGPNDGEMVAIFLEIAKSESDLAADFRSTGLMDALQTMVNPLIEAQVEPERCNRTWSKRVDNLVFDPSRLEALRQTDPEVASALEKHLSKVVYSPYKPSPPGSRPDTQQPGSNGESSSSNNNEPRPQDLANSSLASQADALFHSLMNARSQAGTDDRNSGIGGSTPGSQPPPPPGAPRQPFSFQPRQPPSTVPPAGQHTGAPQAVGQHTATTQAAGHPGTVSLGMPQPQQPYVAPPRLVGAPVPGVSFSSPAPSPFAVATAIQCHSASPRSVWLPRNFTSITFTKAGTVGKVPSDYLQYHSAAMRIAAILKEENPNFALLDYIDYVTFVGDLASNHTWPSIMQFDEAFRVAVELGQYSWSTRGTTLERLHLRQSPTPDGSRTTNSGATVRKREGANPKGLTCKIWNSNQPCPYEEERGWCLYLHACSKCKSTEHIVSKCPKAKSPSSSKPQSGATDNA